MKKSFDETLLLLRKNPEEAQKHFHIKINEDGTVFDQSDKRVYNSTLTWVNIKKEDNSLFFD